jgi:hypothetical protein
LRRNLEGSDIYTTRFSDAKVRRAENPRLLR